MIDVAWRARAQREAGGREVKGGLYAEGSSLPSGSNPAPLHQIKDLSNPELMQALKLMWFFLPNEEPHDPHTRNAKEREVNKRWNEACELYHKYVGGM